MSYQPVIDLLTWGTLPVVTAQRASEHDGLSTNRGDPIAITFWTLRFYKDFTFFVCFTQLMYNLLCSKDE